MGTRIVLLSHSSHLYGAEKCFLRLLKSLDRRRFDPLVLLPGKGPLEAPLRELDVPFLLVEVDRWIALTPEESGRADIFREGLSRRVECLSELLCREGAELALSNSSVVADLALAASRCGVPHLWWIHELLGRQPGLTPKVAIAEFLKPLDRPRNRVVVVSRSVKEQWGSHFHASSVEIIHNGISPLPPDAPPDRNACLELDGEAPIITFVGTLTPNKGVEYFIRAAEALVKAGQEARFVVVGPDGGELAQVQALLREKDLTSRFVFLGYRFDVPQLLACSDLFVLPSVADSFPTVLLEAMQAGLPVIATRSGGAEEIVIDGETGFLVPVADVAAIAGAIGRCLAEPALARRLGMQGRARVTTHFSETLFRKNFCAVLDAMAPRPCHEATTVV